MTGQVPDDEFARVFRTAFDGMGREDTGSLADRPDLELARRAHALTERIGRELAAAGQEGWRRLDAVFALTTTAEIVRVAYTDGTRVTDLAPSRQVLELVREQRALAARGPDGPWWRLLLSLTANGDLEVHYDHGAEPFPAEHRFPPEAYRADLAEFAYPAEKLPTWLAAHVGHGGRQLRGPERAAADARTHDDAEHPKTPFVSGMPDLPVMWARWATLSAAFVAVGSASGPRMLPSHARFENAERGGASLWLLPGDRAVLSGGVWNAPALAATYRGDAPLPDLFEGAPEWVADPVLDARGASGLMSFCYWYNGGRWCRAESPEPEEFAEAMPSVWTADAVTGAVTSLVGRDDEATRTAAELLVSSAEGGSATRAMLGSLFGGDVDGAFHQLVMAGVVEQTDLPPIPEHVAIGIVRDHLVGNRLEAPGYRAADLRAERLSVGWMVYIPVPEGEFLIGRAFFYVADDGVLEQGTTSMPPAYADAEFERRYRRRRNP